MKNGIISLLFSLMALSCKHKISCQNPPPTLQFKVAKINDTDSTSIDNVSVSYTSKDGKKIYITDLRNINGIFNSNELINNSYSQQDTNFSLEINNAQVGDIQLKTYKDGSACDGWIHASEVKLNGKLINPDSKGVYYFLL